MTTTVDPVWMAAGIRRPSIDVIAAITSDDYLPQLADQLAGLSRTVNLGLGQRHTGGVGERGHQMRGCGIACAGPRTVLPSSAITSRPPMVWTRSLSQAPQIRETSSASSASITRRNVGSLGTARPNPSACKIWAPTSAAYSAIAHTDCDLDAVPSSEFGR